MQTLILTLIFFSWRVPTGADTASAWIPRAHEKPFSIHITAVESEVTEGFGVPIKVELTNTSGRRLSASGSYRDFADFAFQYSVRKVGGALLGPVQRHKGPIEGSAVFRTLEPGQSMEEVTDIGWLYHFTPGRYAIQVSRNISSNPEAGAVKSNTIEVTILPPPFSITISTPKRAVKVGSVVSLKVQLANTSGQPMAVHLFRNGSLDPNYDYWCYNSAGKPVMRHHAGTGTAASGVVETVDPGKSCDELIPISAACQLSKPGKYRIVLLRMDPNDPRHRSIKSNEITVEVMP